MILPHAGPHLIHLLRDILPALFLFMFPFLSPAPASSQEGASYEQVPGLIDLRSTFSDGAHSLEELAQLARSRGFRVLFFNDHDRIALSYGVRPFRNLLRVKKALPSIMTHGPETYLAEVDRVSRENPDMILVPGCETSPFYYWTGSYFAKTLTAHGYDCRLLIIPVEDPGAYRSLPVVGNEFSFRYTRHLLPGMVWFIPPLFIGFFLLKRKGLWRPLGAIIALVSGLAVVNAHPFRGSLFDPYQGDLGLLPHQAVIDFANERGVLTFWNYPEQNSGERPYGPIRVSTPPYPQVLYQAKGYTGFSAIYGDRIRLTEPGREWDRALRQYCRGERGKAPWGISTADFHEEGRLGQKLGAFPTVFLVRQFTKRDVLEAMEKGRMYCARGDGTDWPRLDFFQIARSDGGHAIMGETLVTRDPPIVRFRVSRQSGRAVPAKILLIRGGILVRTIEGKTPLEVEVVDRDAPTGVKTYYRLMDAGQNLTSNPIFVQYQPG